MASSTVDVTIPNLNLDHGTLPVPVGGEPETAILGPINGRYDLGVKIARGGMGVVYRAHDRLLNRTVAVKVMRGKYMARPDLMRRFLAEARISARLQHPGIVPVYEVGTLPDGRPFIAMKLIEGETLARLLADRDNPADHLSHFLKAFEVLCQTIAYAHQEGVLHRDLKPDNVMVGSFGEVQVMDWGLAKMLGGSEPDVFPSQASIPTLTAQWPTPVTFTQLLSSDSIDVEFPTHATAIVPVGPEAQTDAGAVFGTAPFMPPEQARGELDKLDRRADVFALGAILCQILTGHPPYYGAPDAVRTNSREGRLFGAYVMLDRCGADPAIVLLAKHCLAVNPADRPADAGVLAGLVNRCLEGLADRAKTMELGRLAAESQLFDLRAQEQLTRKARGMARGLAVTAAVIASLLTGGLWWYAEERDAREAAAAQKFAASVAGIDAALTEAEARAEDARKAPGGPFVRDTAARQAVVSWQKADTLNEATAGVPTDLRERLAGIKIQVDQAERGSRLAVALERWRTEVIDPKGVFDPAAAARRCADTLAAHGFDVRIMTPEAAAASLADHPAGPSIREVLADWLAVTQSADERKHLAEVLGAAGTLPPAPWLAALEANDLGILADLSADDLPAAGVAVVARRLTEAGKTAAAERLLARGVHKHPDHFTLNTQYGTLLRARPSARDEAIRFLSVAVAARPTDAAIGHELGAALADAGRTDEALDVLERAVAADPKYAPALARLGDLFAAQGHEADARDLYAQAAAADPKYAPAQLRLGELALAGNDLSAAEPAFRAAAESEPKNRAARAGLGQVLLKKGDAAAAVPELRAALELNAMDLPGWRILGDALKQTGDKAGAIQVARALAAATPTDPAGHHALGLLLRERGDHMGAIVAFKAAARCPNPGVETFRELGELYEAARDPRAATDAYARAAELDPKNSRHRVALARAQEAAGRPADALRTYRKLQEASPESAAHRQQVGRLMVATGDATGIGELVRAEAAIPDSVDVKTDLGAALLKFGHFREATTALRKARTLLKADDPRAAAIGDAVRHATRLAGLVDRLPDVLAGTLAPSSPAGWAEVGDVARRTNRFAAAAVCYLNAIAVDEYKAPAAVVLALAARGRGTDADSATAEQRDAWRAEALRLWADLPAEIRTDPAFEGLTDQAARWE